jgi:hypothetical protein
MSGADPMPVPHSGIQYAQPWSCMEPGGIFRLAASACVAMPIAAQTAAVIAIIRAIVMLFPRGRGSQINQAGSMLRNQKITPLGLAAHGINHTANSHALCGSMLRLLYTRLLFLFFWCSV